TGARKSGARKTGARKTGARKTGARKKPSPTSLAPNEASAKTAAGRGDVIVVDSPKVGSVSREGEVLEVVRSAVGESYRVRWADGRQSLISPTAGTARVVTGSERA